MRWYYNFVLLYHTIRFECQDIPFFMIEMGLYQAWGVKSGSGVCAGCGAQWLGRGWVATGSTIGVAWVNGHHPDLPNFASL